MKALRSIFVIGIGLARSENRRVFKESASLTIRNSAGSLVDALDILRWSDGISKCVISDPLRLAYRCGNGSGPVSFLNSSTASLSRGMSFIVCSSSSGICGSAFSPVSFVYSFKNSVSL